MSKLNIKGRIAVTGGNAYQVLIGTRSAFDKATDILAKNDDIVAASRTIAELADCLGFTGSFAKDNIDAFEISIRHKLEANSRVLDTIEQVVYTASGNPPPFSPFIKVMTTPPFPVATAIRETIEKIGISENCLLPFNLTVAYDLV